MPGSRSRPTAPTWSTPGGVSEIDLATGALVRHPLARAAKDSRPWRSAALLDGGRTLAVSGCDEWRQTTATARAPMACA